MSHPHKTRHSTQAQRALGFQDGDTLELANQWARVTITRQDAEDPAGWAEFIVTGDLLDVRANRKSFLSATAALNYAMDSLASYQEGRA